MPQVFQVLRCYKCSVFQVHQTKKSNKFQCKLCGEKQSIKRYYGLGTAKDCRVHVQKLNGLRGEIDQQKAQQIDTSEDDSSDEVLVKLPNKQEIKESKWSNFVEQSNVQEDNDNEKMCLGGKEVVLEIPAKKRKQHYTFNSINKKMKSFKKSYNKQSNDEDSENDANETLNHNPTICMQPLLQSQLKTDNILNEKPIINQNIKQKNPKTKFMPPIINHNSKWAQFADELDDDNSTEECDLIQNDSQNSLKDISHNNVNKNYKKLEFVQNYYDDSVTPNYNQNLLDNNSYGDLKQNNSMSQNNTKLEVNTNLYNTVERYNDHSVRVEEPKRNLFSQSDDGDLDELLNF